ncbi:unnamed protein product [Penicillium salamii]|uniref:Epidermal growth factor receptor-like transmembrane-juxtamembrane segment domain-containing protein n=1 Tax=Penicillium salamii TaxID=1612424 RepID=A0A9W4NT06_9EURO|nr:unnamed protein product [Penicillium salamii]
MSEFVEGYAIRRNESCAANEQKCTNNGPTWGDYQACCPGNSFCYDSDTGISNIMCCAQGNDYNCTASVAKSPSCANKKWNLFDWRGYFCCEEDDSGFYVQDRVLVGCSESKNPGNSSFKILDVLSAGSTATATLSTSSSSATSSSTPTSTTSEAASNSSAKSSTNTGAIAGGVVGGVVGLAALAAILVFFMRRRKQHSYEATPQSKHEGHSELPSPPVYSEAGSGDPRKELGGQAVSEMGDTRVREVQELPATR